MVLRAPADVWTRRLWKPHYVQDIDTPAAYDAWAEAHLPHRAKRA